MSRIDEEVEENLLDFSREARRPWQLGVERSFDIRHIFPLIDCNGNRREDCMVDVGMHFIFAGWMREIPHGSDDLADLLNSLKGFIDCFRYLANQVIQIRVARLAPEERPEFGPGILQKTDVVANILR